MPENRSIGERMRRAKSRKKKLETALDWTGTWTRDMEYVLIHLDNCIGRHDMPGIAFCAKQLHAMSLKHSDGLPGVLRALAAADNIDALPHPTFDDSGKEPKHVD